MEAHEDIHDAARTIGEAGFVRKADAAAKLVPAIDPALRRSLRRNLIRLTSGIALGKLL